MICTSHVMIHFGDLLMEILEKYISKDANTASRIIEEEAVIVIPEISEVNTLNKVATRIWELADGSKIISEIISTIQNEYKADPAQVKNDSIEFINKMISEKMLIISDQPAVRVDA